MIEERTIIFIVGNSRSGTTLMGQILDRHSNVHTFEELHFFEEIWSPGISEEIVGRSEAVGIVAKLMNIARDGYFFALTPHSYLPEATSVLGESGKSEWSPVAVYSKFLFYESDRHCCEIPCEQTPRYGHYIKEIFEQFPEARVINMVRDPRDVMLSQKHRWKIRSHGGVTSIKSTIRSWANYHPIVTSLIWRSSVRAARKFDKDERFFEVKFESLVSNPEALLKSLMPRIGLNYDPGMLEVGSITSSFKPDGGAGIDPGRASSWSRGNLSKTEVEWAERICRKEMLAGDYQVSGIKSNFFARFVTMVTMPMKLAIALCFNFQRVNNIREFLKRRFSN